MEALVERKVMESLAAMLNDDGTPVAPAMGAIAPDAIAPDAIAPGAIAPDAIAPDAIAPDAIPVPPLESGAPVPPDAEPDELTN